MTQRGPRALPTPASADKLLTCAEAAERLACSTAQVRRWLDRGLLRGVRNGVYVRVWASSIDDYLTECAVEPGEQERERAAPRRVRV